MPRPLRDGDSITGARCDAIPLEAASMPRGNGMERSNPGKEPPSRSFAPIPRAPEVPHGTSRTRILRDERTAIVQAPLRVVVARPAEAGHAPRRRSEKRQPSCSGRATKSQGRSWRRSKFGRGEPPPNPQRATPAPRRRPHAPGPQGPEAKRRLHDEDRPPDPGTVGRRKASPPLRRSQCAPEQSRKTGPANGPSSHRQSRRPAEYPTASRPPHRSFRRMCRHDGAKSAFGLAVRFARQSPEGSAPRCSDARADAFTYH